MQFSDPILEELNQDSGGFDLARSEVQSVYIGSDDYWAFDQDSFNDETNFYGSAWLVPESKIPSNQSEKEDYLNDNNLSRCQMYFEVGKTDSQLFTPQSIVYDDDAKFVLVTGKQGRIGQPEQTTVKRKAFAVGQKAQRFKNLTEGPKSKDPARFEVKYMIVDDSEEKEELKAFIDKLNGMEEKEEAEEMNAEEMEDDDMKKEMNAENLNRVNPTVVEGAEDIYGAEDMMGLPDPDDGMIIGQDYNGRMIGQAAEDESAEMVDYSQSGEANPAVFGEFVNDNIIGQDFTGQVIGQAAEDEMAEMVDYSPSGEANPEVFGEFVNNNIIGQDFTGQVIGQAAEESYDYSPDDYKVVYDPTSYDPLTMEADNIVEYVQEFPGIREFRLGGFTASILVVGIAALTGAYLSKRK